MIETVVVVIAVMVEREQVHEIADSRTILGHVTVVVAIMLRVRQIIPAPIRDLGRSQFFSMNFNSETWS